ASASGARSSSAERPAPAPIPIARAPPRPRRAPVRQPLPVSEPTPHRARFIAIVGRPNVGKSKQMNHLVGERVAIATPKPQTTRDRIRGIRTFDDWQAIFVDTPGIHEPRTRLNRYMVDLAIGTLGEVDLTYLLVDAEAALAQPDKH